MLNYFYDYIGMVNSLKFITDGMLGKLSRWLRIIGHDVQYYKSVSDENLIEWAISRNRILLTKDQRLVQQAMKRGVKAFFVEGTEIVTKLSSVILHFNLTLEIDFTISRCPKCNGRLIMVSKDSIREKIPDLTSIYFDKYWKCEKCGQIYWLGSHIMMMKRKMKNGNNY
ncbi:MAG: Mut7-C RNAse domain-containing protein [Candidatus Bathyarchaeota archaeon]